MEELLSLIPAASAAISNSSSSDPSFQLCSQEVNHSPILSPSSFSPHDIQLKISSRNRAKRRPITDISLNELWHCPWSCGRIYKRTSTVSIHSHRDNCKKHPHSMKDRDNGEESSHSDTEEHSNNHSNNIDSDSNDSNGISSSHINKKAKVSNLLSSSLSPSSISTASAPSSGMNESLRLPPILQATIPNNSPYNNQILLQPNLMNPLISSQFPPFSPPALAAKLAYNRLLNYAQTSNNMIRNPFMNPLQPPLILNNYNINNNHSTALYHPLAIQAQYSQLLQQQQLPNPYLWPTAVASPNLPPSYFTLSK
jgi:hypothetical protein